jgi:two-component system, NarL family, nitrate/nitrite response regulator NarL
MRILIADDHTLLRDAVKGYLERSELRPEVMTAGSLAEAVRIAQQPQALDLILLDLDMPGMNGVIGIDVIRRARPGVPVAIVSAWATPENVIGALDSNAAAFIPKTMGAKGMLMALQLVLAGEKYVPPELLQKVQELKSRAEADRLSLAAMTPDEARVLELLKLGNTNKEIGRALRVEEYTVKYRLRGIFRKLGAKNRAQAVKLAMERDLSKAPVKDT